MDNDDRYLTVFLFVILVLSAIFINAGIYSWAIILCILALVIFFITILFKIGRG